MSDEEVANELCHWAARCKELYCLMEDDEPGNKMDCGEEHCICNFDAKFEKLKSGAGSLLIFLEAMKDCFGSCRRRTTLQSFVSGRYCLLLGSTLTTCGLTERRAIAFLEAK
jgi:hypothetical protein